MDEDYFSKLPRDCLLPVFARLDRDTLNELECANKALRSVVNDSSLREIRREGIIHLQEHPHSHGVYLNTDDPDEAFAGRAFLASDGGIVRGRRVQGAEQRSRSVKQNEATSPFTSRSRAFELVQPLKATPVPLCCFDAMRELLKQFRSTVTTFENIKVDAHFLKHVLDVFENEPNSEFAFRYPLFELPKPKKFTDFLLALNADALTITVHHSAPMESGLARQFREPFLTALVEKCPAFCLIDRTGLTFWAASNEFLPILVRFETLNLETMVLTPQQVFILIENHISFEGSGSWTFSLTASVTEQQVTAMDWTKFRTFPTPIKHQDMIYRRGIERKGSDIGCVVEVRTMKKRRLQGHLLLVDRSSE